MGLSVDLSRCDAHILYQFRFIMGKVATTWYVQLVEA